MEVNINTLQGLGRLLAVWFVAFMILVTLAMIAEQLGVLP